jgi:hypothetical protein
MAENNIKIFTVKVDTAQDKIAIDGLTKGFVQSQTALKSLNKELANTTKKGVNPLSDATGLAGAAVTELGRGITDLNYGFPAIANNLSQLGSLFTILVARTGGATNAFKLMLQTLRGPLGVLLAFQAVVTIIEAFSKKAKEADVTTKNLTNTFSKQATSLQSYLKILQESNVPLEERKELVEELNEEHKDLNVELDEEGRLTEESARQTLLYVDALKQKARAQAIITQIQNTYQKQLELESKTMEDEVTFLDRLLASFSNFAGVQAGYIPNQKQINVEDVISTRVTERRTEANEKLNEEIERLIKLLTELGVIPEINEKKDKNALKRKKEFVAKELSFADDILKSEENVTKKTIHGKEQQLRAESQYQMDLAQIKFEEYKRRERDRVAAIKDSEDRLKAEKKADEAIKKAQESLSLFKLQKMKETNQLVDIERINDLQKARLRQANFMDKEAEALLAFNVKMATNEMDRIQIEKDLNDERHKNKLDQIDEEIEARKLANKSYVDLEEKQTNEINEYERQKTKFKEKEEKTKLAIANQVGQAIIGIAGEGSAVGKAVAVAMAIMNTKEAITAALGAKPYGPWNIAQAVATGVFGMQQVREIMATKLPVGAGAGGGGAASVSVAAPDFNVVGQGAGSQLAGVVGARFGEPIKAYVLSADVTSAQEMDRKIDSTATIG